MPRGEGLTRGGDGGVDVVDVAERDFGDDVAGGGIAGGHVLAADRRDPCATDELIETAVMTLEPLIGFFGIFRRDAVVHGVKLFRDAAHCVLQGPRPRRVSSSSVRQKRGAFKADPATLDAVPSPLRGFSFFLQRSQDCAPLVLGYFPCIPTGCSTSRASTSDSVKISMQSQNPLSNLLRDRVPVGGGVVPS